MRPCVSPPPPRPNTAAALASIVALASAVLVALGPPDERPAQASGAVAVGAGFGEDGPRSYPTGFAEGREEEEG